MPLAPLSGLDLLTGEVGAALRRRFAEIGFDESALAAAEAIVPRQFDCLRMPAVQWTLANRPDHGSALCLIFIYNGAVPTARIQTALGGELCSLLLKAGVLEPAVGLADHLSASFRLLPFGDVWILSDELNAGPEAVMGPGQTTAELVRSLPARFEGTVLDIGCGPGTLALFAAKRGGKAIGTDLNLRAAQLAVVNARLNGLTAEFRAGDLFAPVVGMRFDHIIAQPPYVIHPDNATGVTFLHGGAMGDEIAMRLVAGLPQALAPGGRALVLFDSVVRPQQPIAQRLREALGPAGFDVVALMAPGLPIDLQAVAYGILEHREAGPVYVEAVRRYLDHCQRLGITSVHHTLVLARDGGAGAPAGGRFTITLPVSGLPDGKHPHLQMLLDALDLCALDDARLAGRAVATSPLASWEKQQDHPDPNVEAKLWARFRRGSISKDYELSEASYVLAGVIDGAGSVAEAVDRYAELCGAQPQEVRTQVLDFVREWLARGLLVPRGR